MGEPGRGSSRRPLRTVGSSSEKAGTAMPTLSWARRGGEVVAIRLLFWSGKLWAGAPTAGFGGPAARLNDVAASRRRDIATLDQPSPSAAEEMGGAISRAAASIAALAGDTRVNGRRITSASVGAASALRQSAGRVEELAVAAREATQQASTVLAELPREFAATQDVVRTSARSVGNAATTIGGAAATIDEAVVVLSGELRETQQGFRGAAAAIREVAASLGGLLEGCRGAPLCASLLFRAALVSLAIFVLAELPRAIAALWSFVSALWWGLEGAWATACATEPATRGMVLFLFVLAAMFKLNRPAAPREVGVAAPPPANLPSSDRAGVPAREPDAAEPSEDVPEVRQQPQPHRTSPRRPAEEIQILPGVIGAVEDAEQAEAIALVEAVEAAEHAEAIGAVEAAEAVLIAEAGEARQIEGPRAAVPTLPPPAPPRFVRTRPPPRGGHRGARRPPNVCRGGHCVR